MPPIIVVQGQPNAEFHITPQLFSALLPQGLDAAAREVAQVGGVQKTPRHAADTVLYGQIGGALVVRLVVFGHGLFLGHFRRHGVLFLEFTVLGGDFLRRADAAQMAVVEPRDLVAHALDLVNGVADEDDRRAAGQ